MILVTIIGIIKTIKVMSVDDQFIFMSNRASLKVSYCRQTVLMLLVWIAQAIFHRALNHLIIYFSSNPEILFH